MNRFVVLSLSLVWSLSLYGQKTTLSGIVLDDKNGETLVGATLVWMGSSVKGTTSNNYGFFSLPGVPIEKGELLVSFIGYSPLTMSVDLAPNVERFFEIRLHPVSVALNEVTIVQTDYNAIGDHDSEISRHKLSTHDITAIPSARNDVFKAMKFLPGIEATEPFSPLLSVRGSDPGENMIMLDGTTVYNPYHFMSSSGIFNMQTVKGAEILAGGFGAEFGGRNASVMNISTKDGDQSGLHGEIQPTTAETKVFLEFPLGKKTSVMTAGRINYDLFGNFLWYSNNYFSDANFSLTHRFSQRNRLTFKYFISNDHTNLDFNSLYQYMGNTIGASISEVFNTMSIKWKNDWNNHVPSLIWNTMPLANLFVKVQLSASLHHADNYSELAMKYDSLAFDTSTRLKSRVNDYSGKATFEYHLFPSNTLKTGVEYNRYYFFNQSELNRIESLNAERRVDLLSLFLEDKAEIGRFTLRPGIRISTFNEQGFLFEPRLNLAYEASGNLKFWAAWGFYNQYIISMNTQDFELNQFLDYYYPLNNRPPSTSIHHMIGAEKKLGKNHMVRIDGYYKNMSRTYTFNLLQSQNEAFALSDKIVEGSGRSMGIEFLWKGTLGAVSGWGSYTLSRSERSFPHIMNGKWYDYDYDRRHAIKAVLSYQATERIEYSASFLALSGVPRSVENTFQMYYLYNPLTGEMSYNPQYIAARKNEIRMPWLFYLDLGLKKELVSGFGKDLSHFFKADRSYFILNVHNILFFRRNILYYLPLVGSGKYLPIGDNYFPVISAGYTIKF